MDNSSSHPSQPPLGEGRRLYTFAFKTFGDFGVTIAVPAVLAALGGKRLDIYFGTTPRYTIILLLIAFALTVYIIRKKVKEYGRAYQELFNERK